MPHATFETELGTCALAWSADGLLAVQLPEKSKAATLARVAKRGSGERVALEDAPAWVKDAAARLTSHLAGRAQDLASLPLDLSGRSPFEEKIYRALQAVGPGATTTYGELAKSVGSPGAARAVGRAMATNPFPVVVPCHRVLAKGGEGGFSSYGGLVTKEKLLAREGMPLRRQTSLFDGERVLPFDGAEAVRHLIEKDRVLGRHITGVGPLRLQLKASEGTFAALAESIVYQQLSGKAAATIFGRVRALYPKGVLDPARVLRTPDASLRAAGLSAGKLASLRDLADRTSRGEIPTLPELERMDDEAIIERLTAVRGVGRWTVEMLLIFRLGRPDVLPTADYGIKKGFAKLFVKGDELPTVEQLERRGERWRPFRSVASWYLWRVLDTPRERGLPRSPG